MDVQIIETPVRFGLVGLALDVNGRRIADVGMELMDRMWRIVKAAGVATTGVNHWVYLPGGRMFVGVELQAGSRIPDQLQGQTLELGRFLKHVHQGPYHALPEKWRLLKAELAQRGLTLCGPSLEIYGHHCDDESLLETTILIGLKPGSALADAASSIR